MKDFALNADGDLDLSSGDLRMIDGLERVRQQLEIKLSLWVGEWFLDTEFGTPYLQKILIPAGSLNPPRDALRRSALEVEDVTDVMLKLDLDKPQRKLSVKLSAQSPFGTVNIEAVYG